MLIFRALATCGSMIFVVKESLPAVKGSLSATQNAKSPQSAEEVRCFSGLVQFYANFLPDFTQAAEPRSEC